VHEPPLFDLLLDDPQTRPQTEELKNRFLSVADEIAAGNKEAAARRFVEVYFGPGAWETFLPEEARRTLINNAPTFLDETRDPELLSIDTIALARFSKPVLLTGGSESPPFCAPVLDKLAAVLPNATRKTFAGAGHMPHITHPQEYVEAIVGFIGEAKASQERCASGRGKPRPYTFCHAVRATSVPSSRVTIS
jgi:pimeloyl-ACP methyl ester carboxylesterase